MTCGSASGCSSSAAMIRATPPTAIRKSPTSAVCPAFWGCDPAGQNDRSGLRKKRRTGLAAMKLNSYWLDTAPAFAHGAAGPVEGRADVVVVGGGFTGLSAALTLARQGVAVTLLEAGRVASEASGRN